MALIYIQALLLWFQTNIDRTLVDEATALSKECDSFSRSESALASEPNYGSENDSEETNIYSTLVEEATTLPKECDSSSRSESALATEPNYGSENDSSALTEPNNALPCPSGASDASDDNPKGLNNRQLYNRQRQRDRRRWKRCCLVAGCVLDRDRFRRTEGAGPKRQIRKKKGGTETEDASVEDTKKESEGACGGEIVEVKEGGVGACGGEVVEVKEGREDDVIGEGAKAGEEGEGACSGEGALGGEE